MIFITIHLPIPLLLLLLLPVQPYYPTYPAPQPASNPRPDGHAL